MECQACKQEVTRVTYRYPDLERGVCRDCLYPSRLSSSSPYVIQDSIEGGLAIQHGLCWPDGTPRTFYSKTDIKAAAYESGWSILGDTPNPNPRIVEERARAAEARARANR